jgi:septum formation protein
MDASTPGPPDDSASREANLAGDRVVLASRSPRRLELLSLLVPQSRIVVRPPRSPEEPGFDGLSTQQAIESHLKDIARAKRQVVENEIAPPWGAILAADTVIVGCGDDGTLTVLGQPPESADWAAVVRGWFEQFYFGRTHLAMTAVSARGASGRISERLVTTRVTFSHERAGWLDWYLATGEPRGKAGGYALQGLASLFVERVEGSLSNVVGLPLAETREVLEELGVSTADSRVIG